jgi:hypothetical protein
MFCIIEKHTQENSRYWRNVMNMTKFLDEKIIIKISKYTWKIFKVCDEHENIKGKYLLKMMLLFNL